MFLVLILFNLGPKERIRPHMGTPVPAPVLCQCLVTSKEGPVGRSCQFRAEKRPPRPPNPRCQSSRSGIPQTHTRRRGRASRTRSSSYCSRKRQGCETPPLGATCGQLGWGRGHKAVSRAGVSPRARSEATSQTPLARSPRARNNQ